MPKTTIIDNILSQVQIVRGWGIMESLYKSEKDNRNKCVMVLELPGREGG